MRVEMMVAFLAFVPSAIAFGAADGGFESGTLSAWRVLGDARAVGTVYDTAPPEGKFQARLQASPSVSVQQAASFAQIDASLLRQTFPDNTRVSMIQQHIDGAASIAVRVKGFTNATTNPSTSIFVIYRADPGSSPAPVITVDNIGPISAPGTGGFAFQSPVYFNVTMLNVRSGGTLTIGLFEPSGDPQTSAVLVDDVRVVDPTNTLTRAGVIPQLASGGGWRTRIVISNIDTVPVQVSARFWNDQGEPYRLILSFPQPDHGPNTIASEANKTLNVHESFVIDWQQPTSSPQIGWAEILTDGRVGAFATFHNQQSTDSAAEASVTMLTPTQSSLLIPFDQTSGYGTALAIVNGTPLSATSLSATLSDDTGNVIWQQPSLATIPANGHVAFSLGDVLKASTGNRGVVEIQSSMGPIGAAVLSFGPLNTLTSTPVF